jgi:hypothetical protein
MAGTPPVNIIEKKSAIAATSVISIASDAHQQASATGELHRSSGAANEVARSHAQQENPASFPA